MPVPSKVKARAEGLERARKARRYGYKPVRVASRYMPHQGKRECARRVSQMKD